MDSDIRIQPIRRMYMIYKSLFTTMTLLIRQMGRRQAVIKERVREQDAVEATVRSARASN